MNPGYTSPPAASMTFAPAGAFTSAPMASIRPFLRTIAPRSIVGEVMG
jgi:hypothetical protein